MDDFTQCLVSNSRMAARAITRRYDSYARQFGVTSTQFSLLGLVIEARGRTVSELAEARGFERTTLTRNLDKLEAMGLISSETAAKGNGRICSLTDKGRQLVRDMLPGWRKAQAEMHEFLGEDGFDATVKVLKKLATA